MHFKKKGENKQKLLTFQPYSLSIFNGALKEEMITFMPT